MNPLFIYNCGGLYLDKGFSIYKDMEKDVSHYIKELDEKTCQLFDLEEFVNLIALNEFNYHNGIIMDTSSYRKMLGLNHLLNFMETMSITEEIESDYEDITGVELKLIEGYGVYVNFSYLYKNFPSMTFLSLFINDLNLNFFDDGTMYINIYKLGVLYDLYVKTEEDKLNIKNKSISKTYLMIDTKNGLIKIGKSKNPKYRERTLQSEKPSINLLTTCNYDCEKELHKKYKNKRVRGEWFDLNHKEIQSIIDKYDFK